MAFLVLSSGMKLAAGAALASVVAVPVVSLSIDSAFSEQVGERRVDDVSQSQGGVGRKGKGLQRPNPVIEAPAPEPVYTPKAPPVQEVLPQATLPEATVAAAPVAKKGSSVLLPLLLGAAGIGAAVIAATSGDDDDDDTPPVSS